MFFFSYMKNVQEFMEIISSSVMERSNKLFSLISVIHKALLEIVAMTSLSNKKQISEFYLFQSLPTTKQQNRTNSGSTIAERHGTHTVNSISSRSTPQNSVRDISKYSTRHTMSTGTMVVASTPTQDIMGQLEPAEEDAILYFCEVTLDVVHKMVLHSHDQFTSCLRSTYTECLSSEDEQERGGAKARRENRVVRFDVPDSPEKVDLLAEVLRQDSEAMQVKLNTLFSFSTR